MNPAHNRSLSAPRPWPPTRPRSVQLKGAPCAHPRRHPRPPGAPPSMVALLTPTVPRSKGNRSNPAPAVPPLLPPVYLRHKRSALPWVLHPGRLNADSHIHRIARGRTRQRQVITTRPQFSPLLQVVLTLPRARRPLTVTPAVHLGAGANEAMGVIPFAIRGPALVAPRQSLRPAP